MACAKRSENMKISGTCRGSKWMGMVFNPKLRKWGNVHMGGQCSHEGCFCTWWDIDVASVQDLREPGWETYSSTNVDQIQTATKNMGE